MIVQQTRLSNINTILIDINSVSEGVITAIRDDANGNLWMILSSLDRKTTYINKFEAKTHRFKHFGIHEKGNAYINALECLSLCEGSKEPNVGRHQ